MALILGRRRNSSVEPEILAPERDESGESCAEGVMPRPDAVQKSGRSSRVDTGCSVETLSYFRCSSCDTGSLGACSEPQFTSTAERFGETELTCHRPLLRVPQASQ